MKQIFSDLKTLSTDPIYGLQEIFQTDTRANKINLSIGVLTDNNGKAHRFEAVTQALAEIWPTDFNYLPIRGDTKAGNLLLQELFPNCDLSQFTSCQSIGGTGALFLLLQLIKKKTAISHIAYLAPTWPNHKNLIRGVGLQEVELLDLEPETLVSLSDTTALLIQPSCNNPTGIKIPSEKMKELLQLVKQKNGVVLFDLPYWGLGKSLDDDVEGIRLAQALDINFLIAFGASKSFGLYNTRTGWAFTRIKNCLPETLDSHLEKEARSTYSSPPALGSRIIRTILSTPSLKQLWIQEINQARIGLQQKRAMFSRALKNCGVDNTIDSGEGLFTLMPLSHHTITTLREEKAIYLGLDGRINIAALMTTNIENISKAICEHISQ